MSLRRLSIFQLIAICVLVSLSRRFVVLASDTQCESSSQECKNPDANKVRLVTREELAT